MTEHVTLGELSRSLTAAFKNFDDPQVEARHLLLEALTMDMSELMLGADSSVSSVELRKVEEWKAKRLEGVPLAYLTGRKAFYKHEFVVRPGVLIPRPETELVVEEALRRAPGSLRIADLGCGSGCIGLSLIKELKWSRLVSVDSSKIAVEVTAENAKRLGVADRAEVVESPVDGWAAMSAEERATTGQLFDLIVANPPYIARGDSDVQPSVHAHEPHEALYSEDNGQASLRSWIKESWKLLRPGGLLVLEFGASQGADVTRMLEETGFREMILKQDLAGHDRVLSAFKPG